MKGVLNVRSPQKRAAITLFCSLALAAARYR
jgi:hypothetical protein